MNHIHVRNLAKYQDGYKDRRHYWSKIYIDMIQGNPEAEMLCEVDFARLVKFIVLESCSQKMTPVSKDYLQRKGFDFGLRSLDETLKELSHFIEIIDVTENKESVTVSPLRKEEKREEKREEDNPIPVSHETKKQDPTDPKNLLADDLFSTLTMFQRETILKDYPEEFLKNTLSRYIATAEQRKIIRMNPGTVFAWLEKDFRETQNTKKTKATPRREETTITTSKVQEWAKEAVPMPEECRADLEKMGIRL